MCSCLMWDGKQHLMVGAGGFISVFKPNNYTYGKINYNDLYIAALDVEYFQLDDNNSPIIVLPHSAVESTDFDISGWEQYLQSGIFIAKINNDTGYFELAEILSRCPLPAGYEDDVVAFLLRPFSTWTIPEEEGYEYGVIFGARFWRLLLPIITPDPPNKTVRIERINAELDDQIDTTLGVAFQWPYFFQMRGSKGTTVTPVISVDETYLRSSTDELRFDTLVTLTETNVTQSGIFGGIHPPNTHLNVNELTIYYREQFGG